jgi:hypothetical protein
LRNSFGCRRREERVLDALVEVRLVDPLVELLQLVVCEVREHVELFGPLFDDRVAVVLDLGVVGGVGLEELVLRPLRRPRLRHVFPRDGRAGQGRQKQALESPVAALSVLPQ